MGTGKEGRGGMGGRQRGGGAMGDGEEEKGPSDTQGRERPWDRQGEGAIGQARKKRGHGGEGDRGVVGTPRTVPIT